MTEYLFACPECSGDVTFHGDIHHAEGECPTCEIDIVISPDEIYESWRTEQHEEMRRGN